MIEYYVRGDAPGMIPGTKKGDWRFRRLLLQGANDFQDQLTELTLDETDKTPAPIGEKIGVEVSRILGVYQGNARIQGKIVGTV